MGTMYMTMFKFFRSRITDFHDSDIKVERYTGQRVVAVNSNRVACYLLNGHYDDLVIRALCIELHAGFNILLGRKHVAGYIL